MENEYMKIHTIEESDGEAIVSDTSENSEVQPNQNGLVCPSGRIQRFLIFPHLEGTCRRTQVTGRW